MSQLRGMTDKEFALYMAAIKAEVKLRATQVYLARQDYDIDDIVKTMITMCRLGEVLWEKECRYWRDY